MKVHFSPDEPALHWSKAFSNIRSNSGQSWERRPKKQALKFTPKHLWSAQTVSKGNKEAHYFVGIDAVDLPQLIKSPL